MTTSITRPQADALAALIHELRPEWGIPGIVKALHDARDRGDAYAVTVAAIHAASDLANRTPAVIAMPGAHWVKGKAPDSDQIRFERCSRPGHTSFPATNCGACRADRIGTDGPSDPPTSHVDPDVATAGAAWCRDQISTIRGTA